MIAHHNKMVFLHIPLPPCTIPTPHTRVLSLCLSVSLSHPPTHIQIHPPTHTNTHPQDLAAGYMSGKSLLKLEAVGYILTNHSPEHFPFLTNPVNSRNRTTFYFTLSKLLFMDDTPQQFKAFVGPLQQVWGGVMYWEYIVHEGLCVEGLLCRVVYYLMVCVVSSCGVYIGCVLILWWLGLLCCGL